MSFVPYERLTIYIGGFVGNPQTLVLDVKDQAENVTTYTLGSSPEITGSSETEYAFSFVPTDSAGGIWRYRWRGKDANGHEFARPSEQRWQSFIIN